MNPFIKPSYDSIWGDGKKSNSDINEADKKPAQKKSRWERFKSWVTEICETFKPVLEIIIPAVKVVTTIVNAYCNFQNCKSRKGNATCAV